MRHGCLAVLVLLLVCVPFAAAADAALGDPDGNDCEPSEILNKSCHPVCYQGVCPNKWLHLDG